MKKKLLGIFLVLVSVLFVGNVYAQESSYEEGTYGTVTEYTQKDALKDTGKVPNVTKTEENSGKVVTITYNSAALKLLSAEESASAGNRPAGYAWVGFKVTLPANVTQNTKESDKNGTSKNDHYTVSVGGKAHNEGELGDNYYAEWVGINEEKLQAALNSAITYTFDFDWNKDSKVDQTVKIVIKPMDLTIYPEDTTEDEEPLWSPEIAKTEVEKAEVAKVVTTEEGSKVTVSGTILPETDSVYKTMLDKMAEKGFKTVFGAYQLSIVQGDTSDGIPLVFTVGKENDGKAAYILHQKRDGSFEEFEGVVKDGVVKITVKELSPFMIALGDVVKDDAPGTNDIFPMALVGMIALGLAGTYVVKKAREN